MGLNCFFCVVYLRGLWRRPDEPDCFLVNQRELLQQNPQLWSVGRAPIEARSRPDGSTRTRRVRRAGSRRASDTKTLASSGGPGGSGRGTGDPAT